MEPDVAGDRSELIAEMKREQSDREDWLPNDCDFWLPLDLEDDE